MEFHSIENALYYPEEKVAILIDGANLATTLKGLGVSGIDYNKLRAIFQERCYLVRILYYSAVVKDENGFNKLQKMFDFLSYNNYNLVTKEANKIWNEEQEKYFIKGNMDVEITVDALKLAAHVDHVILFTGDGDFIPLVKALQEKGVRVSIISSVYSRPSVLSDSLRKEADHFIELDNLLESVKRELGEAGKESENES